MKVDIVTCSGMQDGHKLGVLIDRASRLIKNAGTVSIAKNVVFDTGNRLVVCVSYLCGHKGWKY